MAVFPFGGKIFRYFRKTGLAFSVIYVIIYLNMVDYAIKF